LNGLGAVPRKSTIPQGNQRREASRIRGQRVVLPVGIDSGGYDHRRNELVSTVTARGFEPLRKSEDNPARPPALAVFQDVGWRLPGTAKLFNRDRLSQIPRLIDVGSEEKRRVVREKLQRKGENERRC
jgi:hypothetical protein